MRIKNGNLEIDVNESNGLISGLYCDFGEYNLADKNGMGGVAYTLKGDDIRTERDYIPYIDKVAAYDKVTLDGNVVICRNEEMDINTTYTLEADRLVIESHSDNELFSQYGIDLNFNFLSKKNGTYIGQLLPSSPYTSADGKKMYCIMPTIECGFTIVTAKTPCKAWKIDYSEYSFAHFIQGFKMLSALDDQYDEEDNNNIIIEITFAKIIDEAYQKVQHMFDCPMACPKVTGTFGTYIDVKLLGKADYVKVLYNNNEKQIPVSGDIVRVESEGYGKYIVVPYVDGKAGMDTVIWFGEDIQKLYEKTCDTVKKPYHCDENLTEGMTWLWSMLSYKAFFGSDKYNELVDEEMRIVMGETEPYVPRKTIVPHELGGFPAYHIHQSDRIQEQFFGISILTEMFKYTQDKKYLDFAINTAKTVLECYQNESGGLIRHVDYTTVCAPVIAVVDLAVLLRDIDEKESQYFAEKARKVADFLVKRGFHFPTEAIESEINDEEMEDGSISCTALSILYYCRHIEYVKEYVDFAEKVLQFHDWWRCYTPDVRMNMSSMRWWEMIWEGEGIGPMLGAGHAWSIWRAEADFHMAAIAQKPEYFIKSWNGYMSNFSKTTPEGEMYACYQADYFAGGGSLEVRPTLMHLSEEYMPKTYELTPEYSEHYDNSLSRYVWARACPTWVRTAVVIHKDEEVIPLNCKYENDEVIVSDYIEDLFIFRNDICTKIKVK